MELTTTVTALREAFGVARLAVAPNPTLVAFSGVLLLARERRVDVIGSDGDTTIAAAVAGAEVITPGQALVLPKPIATFLSALDADRTLRLRADDVGLIVDPHGMSPYRFRLVTATFPLPRPLGAPAIPVRFDRLGDAVALVRAAAGRDGPVVRLTSDPTGLRLAATDSYRLAEVLLPEAGFGEFSGVVSLSVLERVARHGVERVTIDGTARVLRLSGPTVVWSVRLLSVPFPDTSAVTAQLPAERCAVDVAAWTEALGRLSAIADGVPVHVRVDREGTVLAVDNADLGNGTEALGDRSPTEIAFAARPDFLREALSACGARAELGYLGPHQPVFLLGHDPIEVLQVVMPIRT